MGNDFIILAILGLAAANFVGLLNLFSYLYYKVREFHKLWDVLSDICLIGFILFSILFVLYFLSMAF